MVMFTGVGTAAGQTAPFRAATSEEELHACHKDSRYKRPAKNEHRWTGNGRGNFDQILTRNPDCCATTLSMTAFDAVGRREAANMNRAPGSEKKSETARQPLEAGSATPNPKLLEFVKALAPGCRGSLAPAQTGRTVMRTAIYARFSTELQQERSIEDQFALCRAYAAKNGLDVTAVYDDRARSGASIFGRDGLMRMMDAARDGAFDVILVEALDRLARDQEDLAGVWKRLNFLGIELRAVHDGKADQIQIGIRGLVGALYLQDLAHKVRRGMSGVIRDGRHAGGRAYGYRPVPGKPGELQIDEDEAAIVREIFKSYVGGKTPREIAMRLNARKVPPPRGRYWTASTLNGSLKRHNGVIQNDLYAGRIVWNKVRMIKDPDTGNRVSRPNPSFEWQSIDAPHLRIVTQELYERAIALKQERGGPVPCHTRKPKRALSGLLKCGCCGAGMSVKDTRKGRQRIQCTQMKEAGTCEHRRVYDLDTIERTVFDGLKANLTTPDLITANVETYNEERKRLASGLIANHASKSVWRGSNASSTVSSNPT